PRPVPQRDGGAVHHHPSALRLSMVRSGGRGSAVDGMNPEREQSLRALVAGLRNVGDEPHFLRAGEEVALGLLEDDDGLAECADALRDTQLAALALATLRRARPRPGPVASVR